MAQITPRVIPDAYEFLACLTQNTEWTPPEDGFYRITCIGKSGDGATGGTGRWEQGTGGDSYGDWICTYYGGAGGNGGGSGGISRSVLDLRASEKIHCTVSSSISSFGSHLSATAAVWNTPGEGKGGNNFNTIGNNGGSGGTGGWDKALNGYPSTSNRRLPKSGSRGGGNGANGGQARTAGENYPAEGGGGGGGGASYNLPPDIAYDDPLVTTYIVQSLANYSGGHGGDGRNGSPTAASSYPAFNPLSPVWYGGGSGGGGASAGNSSTTRPGAAGSLGSPGGILIEKGVFH